MLTQHKKRGAVTLRTKHNSIENNIFLIHIPVVELPVEFCKETKCRLDFGMRLTCYSETCNSNMKQNSQMEKANTKKRCDYKDKKKVKYKRTSTF